MSKNTGTSELINYFDLGANGDVGIAGSLDINTIANATTDTDTFLVSDTGIIKYRTGAELLSDIGAAPATGGSYLPLSGGILTGTTRMDGSGGTTPAITMIFNSGINRLLAPLLRLYGATNESSNYIELYGTLATSNRTINFPDASGTVALTSQIPANPVGGTGTSGTIPVFTGSTTIGNSIIQSNSTQVNIVGNGSQLLFDSLGQTKSGGIQYTNDFELLINNSRGTGSAIFLGNTNIDFNTNVSGNPRLRITDGGNVLVGTTTNNGFKFQVNGGVAITNSIGGSSPSNYLQIEGATANNTNYPSILFKAGTLATTYPNIALTNGGLGLALNSGTATAYNNPAQINVNNGVINFLTGNNAAATERMTITSDGNVGIGTLPNSKFEIRGSTSSPQFRISRSEQTNQGLTIQAGGGVTLFDSYDGTDTVFGSYTFNSTKGTNTVTRMRIDGSGNVGIGTTSPDIFGFGSAGKYLTLQANSGGFSLIQVISDGTSGSGINFGNATIRRASIDGLNGSHLEFYTNGSNSGTSVSPRMRITSGGNVLIGTTTDNGDKFQVSGNATISGSGNTLLVYSNNNSLALGVGFQGVTSGYIGGISSALYGYSTNGGYVLLNASSVWVPASDAKRKRNFEPYTKGLSSILGLQPKLYNMDFQKDGDEKQVGLVAQEVREFIPLAYEENNGFIGLNYNAIIVTMVKAIQQQQEQIQELKNKLS